MAPCHLSLTCPRAPLCLAASRVGICGEGSADAMYLRRAVNGCLGGRRACVDIIGIVRVSKFYVSWLDLQGCSYIRRTVFYALEHYVAV